MTMKLYHCWYFPLLFYESQVMSVGFAAVLWLKPSTSQHPFRLPLRDTLLELLLVGVALDTFAKVAKVNQK